jgi:LacI family transcriptional regulator
VATMRDVAAHAGVSAKTVSRVFNDDPHVLPETRARVEAALAELKYVPNSLATTFRAGRAAVIGVAVPDIADPFFSFIATAVERLAAQHDMSVVVTSLGDKADREKSIVESLLRWQISGLVIAPISNDQRYLRPWSDKLPLVFVDRAPVGVVTDSFTEDDHGGAFEATRHLIGHGHRSIAFIGDTLSVPTTNNRLAGYRDALTAAGIPLDDELVIIATAGSEGAQAAVESLRATSQTATAIFSSNARCTMQLVPALTGERIALVTFGDFPMANMLSPSLTVIDQDPMRLGHLAAERVIARVEHPNRRFRRRTVLPVVLRERESCGPATGAGLFPRSGVINGAPPRHQGIRRRPVPAPTAVDTPRAGA